MLKEREYRCVDLLGPLLCYPVTTAGENPLLEIGDKLLHAFNLPAHTSKFQDRVLVAPEVQRRLTHNRATVSGEELPVAVDIAIPVEAAAISCARELCRKEIDLLLGNPRWQDSGAAGRVEHVRLGTGQDGVPAF